MTISPLVYKGVELKVPTRLDKAHPLQQQPMLFLRDTKEKKLHLQI